MKIRSRLILSFILIVSFGFYDLTDWILKELRPRYVESAEETLVDEAYLLASILQVHFAHPETLQENLTYIFASVEKQKFHAQIFKLLKTSFEQRIYVTDAHGIVLFDSTGIDTGADYSDWKNVRLTLQGQYGARTSYEEKFHALNSILHVSAPIVMQDQIVGSVTVAKPTTNINAFVEGAKPQFVIAGLVATMAVLILGAAVSTWVTWPLNRLRNYAQQVALGKEARLPNLGTSEVRDLGHAFENMKKSLEGKKYLEQHMQTLAHELKSPLAAILATAELLRDDMPPTDQKRFVHNISNEAKRMQDLIERLLQLAALENQIVLLNPEVLDLTELTEAILQSFAALFVQKAIVVKTELAKSVLVSGDKILLGLVLTNVLHNALEFAPNGTIVVCVQKNKTKAEITIANDGLAIPDFALPRLFEKFYSLPRPGTGKKSTGLGLVFAKEILKLHNGDIAIANRDPKGVVVKIILPAL